MSLDDSLNDQEPIGISPFENTHIYYLHGDAEKYIIDMIKNRETMGKNPSSVWIYVLGLILGECGSDLNRLFCRYLSHNLSSIQLIGALWYADTKESRKLLRDIAFASTQIQVVIEFMPAEMKQWYDDQNQQEGDESNKEDDEKFFEKMTEMDINHEKCLSVSTMVPISANMKKIAKLYFYDDINFENGQKNKRKNKKRRVVQDVIDSKKGNVLFLGNPNNSTRLDTNVDIMYKSELWSNWYVYGDIKFIDRILTQCKEKDGIDMSKIEFLVNVILENVEKGEVYENYIDMVLHSYQALKEDIDPETDYIIQRILNDVNIALAIEDLYDE
jgi:hypothetical protein